MVILQAKSMMRKDDITTKEKVLSKKIGKKVVIIPAEYEVIDLRMDKVSFLDWVLNKIDRGNNG
ncbi:hypothetical protein [Clostridium paraputrificum]|uniref:hypothetical protein n=1 Tax=Clostridium paraputrificum TaxID=29363 RepID=UPI00374EE67E